MRRFTNEEVVVRVHYFSEPIPATRLFETLAAAGMQLATMDERRVNPPQAERYYVLSMEGFRPFEPPRHTRSDGMLYQFTPYFAISRFGLTIDLGFLREDQDWPAERGILVR